MSKILKFLFCCALLIACASCSKSYYIVTSDASYLVDGARNSKEFHFQFRLRKLIQDYFSADSIRQDNFNVADSLRRDNIGEVMADSLNNH